MRLNALHMRWTTLIALGLIAAGAATAQDGGGRSRGVGGAPEVRLRPPGERDDWQLGVNVDLLETGARIRQVERGAPADRAGLEVGDIIVTVGGYQVGRVGGQTFTLESELQRQADANGRVRMLVQDKRSNQLTNVDVRLERGRPEAESFVRGRALLPDNSRLPRDAQIRVKLVRRTLLGERVVAETTEPIRGSASGPVEFGLRFDPRRVELDKEHELRVEIESQGRVIFEQSGRHPLRLDPPPLRIDVRLRRV